MEARAKGARVEAQSVGGEPVAARPGVAVFTDPKKWAVCSSPMRLEIIDTLRVKSPCSVAELAAELERQPAALYRHLELLEEAGFVRRAGFRKSGRHVEQLIDLAADDFKIAFDEAQGDFEHQAVVETARSFADAGYVAVRDAAKAGRLKTSPEEINALVVYGIGRLSRADFLEARGLVGRLKQLMDKGRQACEGDLYTAVMILSPMARARKTRANAVGKNERSRRRPEEGTWRVGGSGSAE